MDITDGWALRASTRVSTPLRFRQATNWGSRMGFRQTGRAEPAEPQGHQGGREARRDGQDPGQHGRRRSRDLEPAIEVVRVEVSFARSTASIARRRCLPRSDAVRYQVSGPHSSGQEDRPQHPLVHLQDQRHQGPVPRCQPSNRFERVADSLHGLVRRLCQGCVSPPPCAVVLVLTDPSVLAPPRRSKNLSPQFPRPFGLFRRVCCIVNTTP